LYPFDGQQSSGNQQNDILYNMIWGHLTRLQKLAEANASVFVTDDIKL